MFFDGFRLPLAKGTVPKILGAFDEIFQELATP